MKWHYGIPDKDQHFGPQFSMKFNFYLRKVVNSVWGRHVISIRENNEKCSTM